MDREVKSANMKRRWADAALIADNLSNALHERITKHEVHDYLLAELYEKDLVERAKTDVLPIMPVIERLRGWERLTQKETAPSAEPRAEPRAERDNPQSPAEKLKLAMWFISKFDSADEALAAIQAAVSAVRRLEGRGNG